MCVCTGGERWWCMILLPVNLKEITVMCVCVYTWQGNIHYLCQWYDLHIYMDGVTHLCECTSGALVVYDIIARKFKVNCSCDTHGEETFIT